MTKEQLDKDNEMWSRYVGMHSDEVYAAVNGTKKIKIYLLKFHYIGFRLKEQHQFLIKKGL